MKKGEKATGWKVPLLFCAGIAAIIALAWLFITPGQSRVKLPPDMEERARAVKLELSDGEGGQWKKRIVDAASGFTGQAQKDAALGRLVGDALAVKRFDAACMASSLMKGEAERQDAAGKIFSAAIGDCDTIVWAVYATRASVTAEAGEGLLEELLPHWQACAGKVSP